MFIKFGNLSPKQFADRVGAEFTADELAHLVESRSGKATLVGAEDFHIFEDPSVTIHVGSVDSRTVDVFKAANARQEFNREVSFHLDDGWRTDIEGVTS